MDDSVLIVFPFTFTVVTVEGLATLIPTTAPPVEEILLIILLFTLTVVAVPLDPTLSAVIAAPQLMLVIVLLLTELFPTKFMVIGFIVPVPPLILLKVLPVIVFKGVPPSVLFIPTKPVAPVTVILEKLLFVMFTVDPATELALELKTVTVPPAPPLLNAVTMLFELIFIVPVAVSETALATNVALPVVLTFRFVNVFELMF